MRMPFALLLVALLAGSAAAAELEGVSMPESLSVEGKELKLNGQGLRRKFIFNVYVAGLYVEAKSGDGAGILSKDETRRVDMVMLRDLDRKSIVDALRMGLEKNAGDKVEGLKERMEKFSAVIPDLKKGQSLTVIYVPGKGTRVEGQGQSYTAEGKDFADALFSVWVGRFPLDEGLKKGMLGQR
jgi:hypothetical protein